MAIYRNYICRILSIPMWSTVSGGTAVFQGRIYGHRCLHKYISKEAAFLVRIFHVSLWRCSKLELRFTRKAGWIASVQNSKQKQQQENEHMKRAIVGSNKTSNVLHFDLWPIFATDHLDHQKLFIGLNQNQIPRTDYSFNKKKSSLFQLIKKSLQ